MTFAGYCLTVGVFGTPLQLPPLRSKMPTLALRRELLKRATLHLQFEDFLSAKGKVIL